MFGFSCGTLLVLLFRVAGCLKNSPFQTMHSKTSGQWLQEEGAWESEVHVPTGCQGQQEIPCIGGSRKCSQFLCSFPGLLQPSYSLHAFSSPLFNWSSQHWSKYHNAEHILPPRKEQILHSKTFCCMEWGCHCLPCTHLITPFLIIHTAALSIQRDTERQNYTSCPRLPVWTQAKQTLWKNLLIEANLKVTI